VFITHCPFIKFPVAFASAVEHAIKLQVGQAQIRANPLLIVFLEIEPEEHLGVPFVRHLSEYLPDDTGFLFP
jgi:hypothetical protein